MLGKLIAFFSGAAAGAEKVVVTNDDEHNVVYKRGSAMISPHMKLLGRNPKVTKRIRIEVTASIKHLDAVTAYAPQNWAAFWTKGKGYQVLDEHIAANAEFKSSFEIQKENPDVAREYAESCLQLGLGDEAVSATKHAIGLSPADAGLHANLALAYLISGKNKEAEEAIDNSLRMAPDDKISQAVKRIVHEVIFGKRTQPGNMADLHKR